MRGFVRTAAMSVAMLLCVGSSAAFAYPNPGRVAGDTVVHDPSMLINPDIPPRYLVYGTGNTTLSSQDRITFSNSGRIFGTSPMWWTDYRGTKQPWAPDDMWAPDVSFHNGQYWLYYAITDGPGSRHSAIGVATSTTGLPGSWADRGAVFKSQNSDDYNAIDPNLLVDAQGNWWLTFGSFWSGIYTMSLDPQTGKASSDPPVLRHLAERPRPGTGPSYPGPGIEGPFIFQRGGYYYLFVSFDNCCNANKTLNYNVRVGRSTSPTGPYTDASTSPQDMLAGGGKVVLESHDDVLAPGGQSVYHDDYFGSHDLLVYHYLDKRAGAAATLAPMLGINFLDFSSGWPVVY